MRPSARSRRSGPVFAPDFPTEDPWECTATTVLDPPLDSAQHRATKTMEPAVVEAAAHRSSTASAASCGSDAQAAAAFR